MIPKSLSRKLKTKIAHEFVCADDGYYYWFPRCPGGLSAVVLRGIADLLDAKNRTWDTQVQNELMKQQEEGEHAE